MRQSRVLGSSRKPSVRIGVKDRCVICRCEYRFREIDRKRGETDINEQNEFERLVKFSCLFARKSDETIDLKIQLH